jgi:hypothetical protein
VRARNVLRKLRRRIGRGRASAQVPPDTGTTRYLEEAAGRMVALLTSRGGAEGNLPEIRAVGRRLHERGGTDRMRDLLFEVAEVRRRPDLERVIERAWEGIGDWQG